MGQELGLIPKEETYTNSYREEKTRLTVATKTVRKKKERQRGPSMQGNARTVEYVENIWELLCL